MILLNIYVSNIYVQQRQTIKINYASLERYKTEKLLFARLINVMDFQTNSESNLFCSWFQLKSLFSVYCLSLLWMQSFSVHASSGRVCCWCWCCCDYSIIIIPWGNKFSPKWPLNGYGLRFRFMCWWEWRQHAGPILANRKSLLRRPPHTMAPIFRSSMRPKLRKRKT